MTEPTRDGDGCRFRSVFGRWIGDVFYDPRGSLTAGKEGRYDGQGNFLAEKNGGAARNPLRRFPDYASAVSWLNNEPVKEQARG